MSCLCGGCFSGLSSSSNKNSQRDDAEDHKISVCRKDAKKIQKDQKAREIQVNKEYAQRIKTIKTVPLFRQIPIDKDPLLASACEDVAFKAGEVVIQQGDVSENLFVICSGEVEELLDQGKCVHTLATNDYFGERSLEVLEPSTSTYKAKTKLSCLKLSKTNFEKLGLSKFIYFANRRAVGGGDESEIEVRPASSKTADERALIDTAIKSNQNIKTFGIEMTGESLRQMIDRFWKQDVTEGEEIISAGDLKADYFYVVQAGLFEVIFAPSNDETPFTSPPSSPSFLLNRASSGEMSPSSKGALSPSSKGESRVGPGGSFGEMALLYSVPHSSSVIAKKNSSVWVLDRKSFKSIVMQKAQAKVAEYVKYLEQVNILAPLHKSEFYDVAEAVDEMIFTKGQNIITQGQSGLDARHLYILFEGEVEVYKDTKFIRLIRVDSSVRSKDCFFGERALLNDEPRSATVTVSSSGARVLCLERAQFEELLGPLKGIIDTHRKRTVMPDLSTGMKMKGQMTSKRSSATGLSAAMAKAATCRSPVKRRDLKVVGLLGCGGFGMVELVESTSHKKTFALKAMSKGYIVKCKMQERILNEKDIMLMTDSPFLVKLYECYSDKQFIYLLIEPALGGELYATYKREGFYGSIPHARYYAASVVLAFEHMHERFIIYRDLKPENLLLTKDGRLKLTDMGLARFCVRKAFSTVGTPEYFAPEMIMSSGHNSAVDWWTFGVLVYEFIIGKTPFVARRPMDIYKQVLRGIDDLPSPPQLKGPAKDLVRGLLKKEPVERIPMLPGRTENIKAHPWFADFDWAKIQPGVGEMEPPFRPRVRHDKDLGNFRASREHAPRPHPYIDDGSNWDEEWNTIDNSDDDE